MAAGGHMFSGGTVGKADNSPAMDPFSIGKSKGPTVLY